MSAPLAKSLAPRTRKKKLMAEKIKTRIGHNGMAALGLPRHPVGPQPTRRSVLRGSALPRAAGPAHARGNSHGRGQLRFGDGTGAAPVSARCGGGPASDAAISHALDWILEAGGKGGTAAKRRGPATTHRLRRNGRRSADGAAADGRGAAARRPSRFETDHTDVRRAIVSSTTCGPRSTPITTGSRPRASAIDAPMARQRC